MGSEGLSTRDRLKEMNEGLRDTFKARRRVVSFAEYLDLVEENPSVQLRSAPQFIRDCFDYWGTKEVDYPWGKIRRFKLFDCPWSDGRDQLLGQERVQNQVYRALSNFVSEGAANKLILLHGPNGSAKSTFVRCVGRGMQAYSERDEGAIYRFNWIFPKQKLARGDIGFSGVDYASANVAESFAHLPDEMIDAKITDELRDHPLLLLPLAQRRELFASWLDKDKKSLDESFVVADYLQQGHLSHRNRAIFQALLTNYKGDYLKVLRHVQVERFFVSHRYREGYVTVEPQLSIDAHEMQITQDSSIAALPAALQSLALFKYGGQLVTGNRGLIEYSDLLKRPLEAFKYLLTTVEHASVSLQHATLFLDLCFIGTSNEIHLSAFKEIAEFQSFKGRVELVRVPYLLDIGKEERIYHAKLKEAARSRHVAPHCAYVAALWAVLTRMRKPMAEKYGKEVSELIAKLSPVEKAELYSDGTTPPGLTTKQAKELRAHLGELHSESDAYPVYEGLTGASPRELQSVLFNAANSSLYAYVSPLAILDEIDALCTHTSVYDFLKQEPLPGGYHDHRTLIIETRKRLLDRVNDEFRGAMGLVADDEYVRVFQRYILHVMHFTKGEKLENESTGKFEGADEKMMSSVETTLGVTGDAKEFRNSLIAKIGAWSLDHKGDRPAYQDIFASYFIKLRDAYFATHARTVAASVEHFLMYVTDGAAALNDEDRAQSKLVLDNLIADYGYSEASARDIIRVLARERYAG